MAKNSLTSEVIDGLLTTVAVAGVLGITVVAPNGISALEKPLSHYLRKSKEQKELRRIGRYMQKQALVKITDNNDGSYQITLTKKGQTRSSRVRFEQLQIPEEKWDEKWRVFMFDIPEQYKTTRDYISRHMRQIGFKQLQKSVFVYPYPVDEFIELVKDMFPEIEKHISYMVAEETDQHNALVKRFKHIL